MTNFKTYQSPFSWRYGSSAMRSIWSEENLRITWRRIWTALAETQADFGLVNTQEVQDLQGHQNSIDIEKSLAVEQEIHHDLMAELKVYADQCAIGGRILHLGATSMDIKDNADILRIKLSLETIEEKLCSLLKLFAKKISASAELPLIAFTHLQPAEPTTLGYRLALTAQDLLTDLESIRREHADLKAKGIRGAVGTGASFIELIGKENLAAFEARLADKFGVPFYPIVSQTYPRKQDFAVLNALAHIGITLSKFAFDLRLLQNPTIGEWAEPFGSKQVGSSAMPFKRNPIKSEKMNSLARLLAQYPRTAWDNAANSLLERTLDDSANRRTILPEAFLTADELLDSTAALITGLQINQKQTARNLDTYGPFAASERVMMALTKAGGDRQVIHEKIRELSLEAWESISSKGTNPLNKLIANEPEFLSLMTQDEIRSLMDYRHYTGDAADRCRSLAAMIKEKAN